MLGKRVVLVVVVVVLLGMVVGLEGLELCDINEDGLVACKPSVTQPDPVDPTQGCCDALKVANLTCLCGYRNSFMLPSLGIDPDLAMALPAKCNLSPPPNC
ncbi:unnamed protein product [Camellia sinensis]|uniref:Bifunctional inhibitor/plant lipid transfer protein/seed storage helical domain-containing protein n=1 Tax=Camellia sinensis TaxID=4442 RepID=A0A7J7FRM9_CAMSI|nr:hypothetical protein HYC85_031504 [Camellia sinensis]